MDNVIMALGTIILVLGAALSVEEIDPVTDVGEDAGEVNKAKHDILAEFQASELLNQEREIQEVNSKYDSLISAASDYNYIMQLQNEKRKAVRQVLKKI